jgi:hypothetical protein
VVERKGRDFLGLVIYVVVIFETCNGLTGSEECVCLHL